MADELEDLFESVIADKSQGKLDELYASVEAAESEILKENDRIRDLKEQQREIGRTIKRAENRRDRAEGLQAYLSEEIGRLVNRLMRKGV